MLRDDQKILLELLGFSPAVIARIESIAVIADVPDVVTPIVPCPRFDEFAAESPCSEVKIALDYDEDRDRYAAGLCERCKLAVIAGRQA